MTNDQVSREDFHKISSDLTRSKNLLVRLWDKHPYARKMIEAATGDWFVWGVDQNAAFASNTAPAEPMPRAILVDRSVGGPLDTNELEAFAKRHPDDYFLKGSGVLKLIAAIRSFENAKAAPAVAVEPTNREAAYESLLKAASGQLKAWHQKYGNHAPSWLPPGGDVSLLETIDDWLDTNTTSTHLEPTVHRGVKP